MVKLRPYQEFAYQEILKKPACALFLDMGLGKTLTTLAAINDLINDYLTVGKVLIIAPLRVAETTWPDEVEKWKFPLSVSVVTGSARERVAALKRKADIYTINRENVPWLCEVYAFNWPFDMVVIDESSSFKNNRSKRFKSLRRIRPKISRLVELSGTPSPNGLMDLWSQLYLLDRGKRLGKTITEYRNKYFYPTGGYGHVVYNWRLQQNAQKEIYKKISDICISMKSEDFLTLPPIIHNVIKVELSKEVKEAYKRLEHDLILPLVDSDIVATTAATLSGKLLQFANGAAYDENGHTVIIHEKKLDALQEIIEANEHKNIMVFYWFKFDLKMLKKRFPKANELKTAQDIRDWNAGKIPLLLVHPASAGHGLNLQQGGSVAVWYSLTWSLELYEQANKRLHRSGQKHTVVIHHLVAAGTVDEDVIAALKNKRRGQDGLMQAIKAKLAALSK